MKNRIGPYQLMTQLAEGDFGITYLGKRKLEKDVCSLVIIKLLSNQNLDVLQEAHILTNLNHPNVIKIVDILQKRKTTFMIYEHIPGWDLDIFFKKVKQEAALGTSHTTTLVLKILEGVLNAVLYLHTHRIIHGDIHPTNIRITPFLDVKIIDFGTCQKINSQQSTAAIGARPQWSPPEKISQHTEHPSSDFYTFSKLVMYCTQQFSTLKDNLLFSPLLAFAQEACQATGNERISIWKSALPLLNKNRVIAESKIHTDHLPSLLQQWEQQGPHVPTISLAPVSRDMPPGQKRYVARHAVAFSVFVLGLGLSFWGLKAISPNPNVASPTPPKIQLVVQARPWAKIFLNETLIGSTPIVKTIPEKHFPLLIRANHQSATQSKLIHFAEIPKDKKKPLVIRFDMKKK